MGKRCEDFRVNYPNVSMLEQFIEIHKDASNLLNKNRLQGMEVLSSLHMGVFFF